MTQATVTRDENAVWDIHPAAKRVTLINVLPKNIELGMRFVPDSRGLMNLDRLGGRKTEEITSYKWSRHNFEVVINEKYVYGRNGEMYVVL